MLTKDTIIDKIEVLEDGQMQVREATYILENGVRIAGPTYHRVPLQPGENIGHLAAKVRQVAAAVWTPEVVEAYEEAKAEREAKTITDVKAEDIRRA